MATRDTIGRISDIVKNIDLIEEFTDGFSVDLILKDIKTEFAVKMALMNIGEAGKKLGNEVEELLPNYRWRQLYGMCNIIRHKYDQIDISIVCNSVEKILPDMRADCIAIIQKLENGHIKSADVKPSN